MNTNSEIIYRIATITDAKIIAKITIDAFKDNVDEFTTKLGSNFMTTYFRTIISTPGVVIICAERDGVILGYVQATIDAIKEQKYLKNSTFKLALSVLPKFIVDPWLFLKLLSRYRSLYTTTTTTNNNNNNRPLYNGIIDGTRITHWVTIPSIRKENIAFTLMAKCLDILKLLGSERVRFDVYKNDQKTFKNMLLLGATVVEEYDTSDHKQKILMEIELTNW
jgi:hypothetical protein